jgi:hypothetical protein
VKFCRKFFGPILAMVLISAMSAAGSANAKTKHTLGFWAAGVPGQSFKTITQMLWQVLVSSQYRRP